jgi:hypothetical protein
MQIQLPTDPSNKQSYISIIGCLFVEKSCSWIVLRLFQTSSPLSRALGAQLAALGVQMLTDSTSASTQNQH